MTLEEKFSLLLQFAKKIKNRGCCETCKPCCGCAAEYVLREIGEME